MSEPLFLGLDLSTQQLKAVLISASNEIVHESAVHFDNDLPHHGTTNGAIHHDPRNGRDAEVTVPVGLWIEALDLLFERMTNKGPGCGNVLAVGGSAQQHGSVYWSRKAKDILSNLNPEEPLAKQLVPDAFSLPDAPIWQDSSTTPECAILTEAAGGDQALADLTGSRAYERFTGSHIMKVYKTEPEVYQQTGGISLVSSFLATIFLDASCDGPSDRPFPAPFEASDASGMNLMNISTHLWEDKLLEACGGSAQDLRQKLGGQEPIQGGTGLGTVGSWAIKRWGFNKDCVVSPFTGDNPGTVAALIAEPGAALLSLGTSTTFLLSVPPTHDTPKCTTSSHLLAHPTSRESSIIMLCYKNGALARENMRDLHALKSWDTFNERVKATEPGSSGYIGLYFPLKEIIPPNVQGNYFFRIKEDGSTENIDDIPDELHARAILESQLLSIKSRIVSLVPPDSPPLSRILITGGSARNALFQQVIADVFNMDVYITSEESSKEAAALGGALLAKWVWWREVNKDREDKSYDAMIHEKNSGATGQILVAKPDPAHAKVYDSILDAYRQCEQWVVEHS